MNRNHKTLSHKTKYIARMNIQLLYSDAFFVTLKREYYSAYNF